MKLALAIVLSLGASLAQADTLLTYQSPGKPVREIAIAGGKVNMKMSGENADVLFDTRLRAMSIVNHAERRYIVMDEAGIQKMAEFANQMMKMMENLPPQVREQMKGMMGGQGMPGQRVVPQVLIKRSGRRDKVNGMGCELVESWVDGRKQSEMCVAPHSALKIPAADLDTLKAMFAFSKRVTEKFEFAKDLDNQWQQLGDQIPLRMIDNLDGNKPEQFELKSVSNGKLPESRFTIPAGYQQQKIELPQGMPGMGG
ncbi:MAG: DUF4412 domain-containing protein [Gammaproteobacteria bacterium]|nr:DUF4412 domain-containing protein [Gammaproteobacteria bacterium]